jgi:PBSX family phage terminase large subunit
MNYGHFNIFDNLSIDNKKLKETLRTYNKDSMWYKRDILGHRVAPDGIIYDMVDEQNYYNDGEGPDLVGMWYKRFYGVDPATGNPFGCVEVVEQNGILYVESEYYYDSKSKMRQKEAAEYVDDLKKHIGDKRYTSLISDPEDANFKLVARNRGLRVVDAKKDVLDGIKRTQTLFATKRLKINRKCKNLINELSGYAWDVKALEKGEEKPLKIGDHLCDALRYVVFTHNLVRV